MDGFRLDSDMIISKKLSSSDVNKSYCRMLIPKNQMISVLRKMKNVTDESLRKGIKVEILDIVKNISHFVVLKYSDKENYYLGSGWSAMRQLLDLKAGDDFILYWDYLNYKFIILNFEYSLISD